MVMTNINPCVPMHSFSNPWKHHIILLFSGDRKIIHCERIGNRINQCYWKLSLKFFVVNNFCLPTELGFIHPIFIWSRPKIFIKHAQNSGSSILSSNNIINFVECEELEISCKRMKISFLGKVLPSTFTHNVC